MLKSPLKQLSDQFARPINHRKLGLTFLSCSVSQSNNTESKKTMNKTPFANLTSVSNVATSSVKGLPKTPEQVTSPEKSNTNTQMLSPIYNEKVSM